MTSLEDLINERHDWERRARDLGWTSDDDPPVVVDAAGKLACPQCQSTALATVERLTGVAFTSGITRDAAGSVDVAWMDGTDVDWNSSTTVGVSCRSCYWQTIGAGWSSVLVVKAS